MFRRVISAKKLLRLQSDSILLDSLSKVCLRVGFPASKRSPLRERERDRERETDRQRDRQRDTETDRETDREQ